MEQETHEAPRAASVRWVLEEGVALVTIDVPSASVNTLSTPLLEEFERLIDEIEVTSGVEGIVLLSGKDASFVAGFDIEELRGYGADTGPLRETVARGHELMGRMEGLEIPVVSAIHGACLGGGLELVLATHARIASNHPKTKLGLPEVMLGVIPGGGGTQRLPRLIDLQAALDMILTGRQISAKKALRMGLVDDVVHPGQLRRVAVAHVRKLALERAANTPAPSPLDRVRDLLDDPANEVIRLAARTPARKLIFDKAREGVLAKTGGHYPAPIRALEVIEAGLRDGLQAGLRAEAEAFVELVATPTAGNLMNLFFMRNESMKDGPDVDAPPVRKIGVLGAGLMGAGIAQGAAFSGYAVRLKDRDAAGLTWGMHYADDLFQKLARRRKITSAEADIYIGHITPTTTYSGFKRADVVIEAVFEDLALKQQVLADVEALGNEDQIFASNTSTIPIAQIAANAQRPENVLGMHFFSPVHKMPLLEIIKTDQTRPEAVAAALEIGRSMGKTCIVVHDGPGFFTSRVIGAYINEAGWLVQEGARVEDIDAAMERFGFPVGPMKLVDEVGIDVGVKAGGILQAAFADRWEAPSALQAIVDDGRKGRKNGRGFYRYEDGASKGVDEGVYALLPDPARRDMDAQLIIDRCWLAMLNECAMCLEEGIATRPQDIDLGVIFGLGFPPFRGGILRHADAVGVARVTARLHELADAHGARLRPANILEEMAARGASFYDAHTTQD